MAHDHPVSKRVNLAGMELIIDSMRQADGSLVDAAGESVTPQSAPAANGGVAVTIVSATATSGSFPTPDGSWTVSNAATPTVVELQEGIIELRKNVIDLITENATFKTSINALRTALLAAGVFI